MMAPGSNLMTPVVLLIFNRPEVTARVFAAIREARPMRLFIIADGPREGNPTDMSLCAATRSIVEQVDWPCDVRRLYSDTNLGCGLRPASGISWVFEQVDEAIIIEDDCLPHQSFFAYCQELLTRYRDDERIMHIAGNNSLVLSRGDYSYYFSMFPHCWGWATWKRAWRHFDYDMRLFPRLISEGWLECLSQDSGAAAYWYTKFKEVYGPHKKHIWDYQWTFACLTNNGLSILPNRNLICNIGFGADATHTKDTGSRFASLPVTPMEFPLSHPPFVIRDARADTAAQRNVFRQHIVKAVLDAVRYRMRAVV